MQTLEKNKTREIVYFPREKKTMGWKWVFIVKYKSDGNIERCKARFVAKGFTQTYEIDYQKTFAPVAKMNSIRVLLSLVVNLNWSLQQVDVKKAFWMVSWRRKFLWTCHWGLKKFMKMEKFADWNSLWAYYELKQSLRAWIDWFTRVVKGQGYL